MPTHLPSLWLDPISCRLVSLLSCVDWSLRRPSPTASSSSFVQLSDQHSLPTSSHPGSPVQNPLSGFTPKQTKESSAWQTTYIVLQPNHSWEDKGVHIFLKSINLKVNIIAQLEFELTYYDIVVQHVNHYTMETFPSLGKVNSEFK